MIIYKATNKINGKIYIGQTVKSLPKRKSQHLWDAKRNISLTSYFHKALRKYKTENFDWEVIDKAETQEELNEKEIYWISYYNSTVEGYNISLGGQVNAQKSEAGIANITKAKGIPIYCHQNGKIYGAITLAAKDLRVSSSLIGMVLSGMYLHASGFTFEYLDDNKIYPLPLREKVKYTELISVYCHQNQKIYPSMKQADKDLGLAKGSVWKYLTENNLHVKGYTFEKVIDESIYPLPLRPRVDLSIRSNQLPVLCISNGIEYKSTRDAARQLQLDPGSISRVCNGKLNHTKGYKFIYKHELKIA